MNEMCHHCATQHIYHNEHRVLETITVILNNGRLGKERTEYFLARLCQKCIILSKQGERLTIRMSYNKS